MANIIITQDATFLYITFNDVVNYSLSRKIRKSDWWDTNCLLNGGGVELSFTSGYTTTLHPEDVDSVNGNPTITTDVQLYNALIAIM